MGSCCLPAEVAALYSGSRHEKGHLSCSTQLVTNTTQPNLVHELQLSLVTVTMPTADRLTPPTDDHVMKKRPRYWTPMRIGTKGTQITIKRENITR